MEITRKQLIKALIACEKQEHMTESEMKEFSARELAELRADDLIKNLKEVGAIRKRRVKAVFGFQRGNYYCSLVSSNGNVLFHGSGWNTKADMKKAVAAIKASPIKWIDTKTKKNKPQEREQ